MSNAATAYISLGSNLGDREGTIRQALTALAQHAGIEVRRVSRLIETAPVGPPQGNYLNAAAELRTQLPPEQLLQTLLEVEEQFGRVRAERWGPRRLDLDLLLYGDAVIETPLLRVPHPQMHKRRFVLEPLCDIAPLVRHPILGKTAAQLLDELQTTSR